jgi:hypothetical protein
VIYATGDFPIINENGFVYSGGIRAQAVNQHGGFGIWQWSVSKDPADVAEILEKANEE